MHDETPRFDPDLYKAALDVAARIHRDQKVPGPDGIPYVVHIAKVAMEVIAATEGAAGVDRDLAVACAVLHDTVEDSEPLDRPKVIENIRATFGREVTLGVLALTKDEAKSKPDRMADSLRRIREQPREVWMVKLADRITNLEPPPTHWTQEKRLRYLGEAREILSALGDASPLLRERFERKLVEYEGYCRG